MSGRLCAKCLRTANYAPGLLGTRVIKIFFQKKFFKKNFLFRQKVFFKKTNILIFFAKIYVSFK